MKPATDEQLFWAARRRTTSGLRFDKPLQVLQVVQIPGTSEEH